MSAAFRAKILPSFVAVALLGVVACGKTVDPNGCHHVVDAICMRAFQCVGDADPSAFAIIYGHSVSECESYYGGQCDAPDADTLCQGLRTSPEAETCAQIISNASCAETPSCADAGIVCRN